MLPDYVRLTRAAVIGELAKEYVRRRGSPAPAPLRLMFDTVLPNCAAPLIVQATLGFSTAILDAAALGFLGLGAQPPTPEWGSMLASAREYIQSAWWVVTARPGDPDHRAGVQPDGRRPARRARPQAEAMSDSDDGPARNRNLTVEFGAAGRRHRGGQRRRPTVDAGEVVGIVGESGSGKSVTMLALMGLIDAPGRVRAERLAFAGHDLLDVATRERRAIVGGDIAMIFQDPMTSLNPCSPSAFSSMETLRLHEGRAAARSARARALRAAAAGRDPGRRARASTPSRTSSPAA